MDWFSRVTEALTGNFASEVFNTIKAYFPPSMSEQEKNQLQVVLQEMEDKRRAQADQAAFEALQQFNERIKALEGTAADLKTIPVLGPIVIFLRGCQRPIWGFLTMYLDVMWFSAWVLNEQQQTALIVINLLVLGFLFGERAVRNLEPLLLRLLGKRKE